MNKKKLATSVVAVATAAALLLGGTFAWQSVNQTALNEGADTINPGGRLHDDFDGINKDVYVENFTDPENGGQDIFARVRLEEYLEVVLNYGTPGQTEKQLLGEKYYAPVLDEDGNDVVDDEGNPVYEPEYTYEYVPYTGYDSLNGNTVQAGVASKDDGASYWNWQMGGSTVYMPTFNMNKDSLEADINGEYLHGVGVITDKNIEGGQYSSMKTYTDGETKTANEIWDTDSNDIDELAENGVDIRELIEQTGTDYDSKAVKLVNEPHTAQPTLDARLISMSEWLTMVEEEGYDPDVHGGYWVYDDTDDSGWVYWSAPIAPGTATGLLLDGIELNRVMDDTWYYAINVVAQFVTADDAGAGDGTGFYDETKGEAPSWEAEQLLTTIGVTLDGSEDDDEENRYFNELVLDYDAPNNIVKGGEMIEFWAEVYDENGDWIAGTNEVEFTAVEVLVSEAAAAEEVEQSFMANNFLIVADDLLDRDVASITVTATYTDESGKVYSAECEFVTEAEESPLKTKFLFSGTEKEHLYGDDPVFQVFTHDPSSETYEFSSSLNGEAIEVEWGLKADSNYTVYTTEEDATHVYALANEEWQNNGWKLVAVGSPIAKINKTTGAFDVLIGDEFPMSCTFMITSRTIGETNYERYDLLFIAKRVVEFQLRDQNSDSFGDTYYTPGDETQVVVAPYILKEGQLIPQTDITEDMVYDWNVYVGEYYTGDNEQLTIGEDYTLTYNAGTWTLTILDTVDQDSIFVRALYDYGEATPHYADGIHKADLRIKNIATASSGVPNDMEICDESGEFESTYMPGEYSKIRLEAMLYDAMGEYVYSSNITWQVSGNNVRVVGNGNSGELQIRGSTDEKITVHAMYTDVSGEGSNLSASFVITAEEGPDTTAPTVSNVAGDGLIYTYTITDVSDADFPMTMNVYWASDENVYAEGIEALYTIEFTLSEEGVVAQTGDGTGGQSSSVTYEDGTVTSSLNTVVMEDGYWGVTVTDVSGNVGVLEEPINVQPVTGCFVAGTQVQTVNGLVNIENIKIGDMVYSVDLTTGEKVVSPVTWVQGTRYIDATYTIYAGDEKVVTTYEHPFYVIGKEWVAAEDLVKGDKIKTVDGEVAITDIVYTQLDAPVQVYNFTVDGTHNYLISETGLLVHNITEK